MSDRDAVAAVSLAVERRKLYRISSGLLDAPTGTRCLRTNIDSQMVISKPEILG
jgi:hypothetical protein